MRGNLTHSLTSTFCKIRYGVVLRFTLQDANLAAGDVHAMVLEQYYCF